MREYHSLHQEMEVMTREVEWLKSYVEKAARWAEEVEEEYTRVAEEWEGRIAALREQVSLCGGRRSE